MDIAIKSLIAEHLCEVVMPKFVTIAAAKRFDTNMSALLDQLHAPIYVLVELKHVSVTAPLTTWTIMRHLRHPNLGPVLAVGLDQNLIMSHVTFLIRRVVPFEIVRFDTRTEALMWLETKGISLNMHSMAR